ncbi:MAG: ATP-binding protein [Proteobacteria bacterium]|nr:ATP-binding protein [Pseudomonadota bacterium]
MAALILFRPVGGILDWVGILPDTPVWTSADITALLALTAVAALVAIVALPQDTATRSWLPFVIGALWVLAFLLMFRDAMVFARFELAILLVLHVVQVRWQWMHPLSLPEEPPHESGIKRTPSAAPQRFQPTDATRPAENHFPTIQFQARRARFGRLDIVGATEVVVEMEAAVAESLWGRPGETEGRRGAASDRRNGILLAGDPGNGKTFLAEVMAGIQGVDFISVSFGDVSSKWINETTQLVMKVFDDAIAQAPCVLLIDEIDSLLMSRQTIVNADSETAKTANAILTRLTEVRGKRVCVIAATNFPDKLDAAGTREGRFDFKITLPGPDLAARIHLLRSALATSETTVEKDLLTRVAGRWEGFSAKRMLSIGQAAAEMCPGRTLSAHDLFAALRKVRGFGGARLPEDTPGLSELHLACGTRLRLRGLVERMRNVIEVEQAGGGIPSGILFYGPPGTGKTLVASALAKETEWSFVPTVGADLIHREGEIDRLLQKALNLRPSIIFIDEAEDILGDRATSLYGRAATNRLLEMMNGSQRKLHDVLFIAATNHPEVLDDAMLRGGRFGERIRFDLPSEEIISRYVGDWLAHCLLPVDPAFTATRAAKLLTDQSLATVKSVLTGAVNRALEQEGRVKTLTLNHLTQALCDAS